LRHAPVSEFRPALLQVPGFELAFLVAVIIWNLDDLREAWRADRVAKRQ
jgi:hypothetical protein